MLSSTEFRKKIDMLCNFTKGIDSSYAEQAEHFIDVGEHSLALDTIAGAYLTNVSAMPTDLFAILEELAIDMKMDRDPEFEAVAKLRAAQGSRVSP